MHLQKDNFTPWFIVCYLGLLFFLSYFVPRESFLVFISLITLAHVFYLSLVCQSNFSLKHAIFLAFVIRLLLLGCEPLLSDDYYRFFWDGLCLQNGLNPYSYLPSELKNLQNSYPEIYEKLNSTSYYSVYTPLNLVLFYTASIFQSKWSFIVLYRIQILLFESIGAYFLIKSLKIGQIKTQYFAILYLNPLLVLEFYVNLHVEGIVMSFLVIGIYFYLKNKTILSNSSLILAVQLKLIPVLILISYWKNKGFTKTVLFGSVLLLSLILFYFPVLNKENVTHYVQSLGYYFKLFEFNSSLYLLSKVAGDYAWTGFFFLPKVIFIGMLIYLFRNKTFSFFETTLFVFSAYLLCSQSVHPWYIVGLLVWVPFTGYFFPLVWAYFSMWTYYTYSFQPYEQHYFYNFVEYSVLTILLWIELKSNRFSVEKPQNNLV